MVEFNKIAAFQTKHTQQQTCEGVCSIKRPFLQWFSLPAIFNRLSNTAKASVEFPALLQILPQ